MNAMGGPTVIDLKALSERFDIFLLDQFGVLHDGNAAYPGAVEALAHLKAAGKRVVLLSNSGRRAGPNEGRLERLGFPRASWDRLVTSGEVAWHLLSGHGPEKRIPPGSRCLYFARDGDRTAVEGLDLQLVEDGADADLVLIAGSEADRLTLDDYRGMLAPAAARDVPCMCTNPDKIMLTTSGPRPGAGRIAEIYTELGGKVRWIGKPFKEIYQAALDALGNPDPARVVCVGDSVEHDIAGGHGAGLATALVRSGILADLPAEALSALYREHGAAPEFVLPGFYWTAG
ncbi:TIGR01459 family HAD-type hydrolase [Chelativorans sp. M5D2P16]|uniref:TIGR01459 family HAD-type hydrolase n=1 Tax=Chelativorans sp. M5D2P16 TaxID=3095678 RepID=UPI003A0FEF7B